VRLEAAMVEGPSLEGSGARVFTGSFEAFFPCHWPPLASF
jgi:hypothetical protein